MTMTKHSSSIPIRNNSLSGIQFTFHIIIDVISTITLDNLLPGVFDGMQHQSPVKDSGVWCHDLTLSRPGRYLITAESGTGKSSLCSYIYGLRRDYSGRLLFDGEDTSTFTPDRWTALRRDSLAYLPQEMRLFPELTALENILIKNRLTDYRSGAEITALMQRLGIDNRADFPAGRLSVGQQQRVAIIRAICQPFSFIILDEPVSHLDERNNTIVASLVTEAAEACGAAVIATSVGNHLNLPDPHIIKL